MAAGSLLSAKVHEDIRRNVKSRLREIVEGLSDSILQDGYSIAHKPLSDRQTWEKLNGMRAASDPRFFDDPRAMADYERLAKIFGAPPPRVSGLMPRPPGGQ